MLRPHALGASGRHGTSPAIQVVTDSLNGLNVEIKANLYEKAVFLLSLSVGSGLELGACALSSCLALRAHVARKGRHPPRGPLLVSSPDEEDPFLPRSRRCEDVP